MHRTDLHLIRAGRHTAGTVRLRPPTVRPALWAALVRVRLVLAIWLIERRSRRP
ncbi:MAG TPA: hypothetical protein PKC15_07765 [Rhodocyclaceae bacterium]|uniref:hypothetical protein n=1 Tax=Plasticicumulans sp. TaxID=2307179 RepID=UPI002B914BE9|nr:hypothetical protein [Rhodocyclaceae bacterium]